MESKTPDRLHIFFFPYLALGHIIPQSRTARLFAERGVKVSFVTTKGNITHVRNIVDDAVREGHCMQILEIPFPSEDVGLPVGCENTNSLPMSDSALEKFGLQLLKLDGPFHQLITDHRPDCVIVDQFYHWASHVAISHGIPCISYVVISHFATCIQDEIEFQGILSSISPDTEPFTVPGIPHKVEITKAELPKPFHYPTIVLDIYREAQRESYGTIINGFDELAPEYLDILKKDGKRRVWNVGPVSVIADKVDGDDELGLKSWLDCKVNKTILYVAFGSECFFNNDQLRELSLGLEESGYPFIWVVRGGGGGLETIKDWLPTGFEKRVEGRGLIIRKWAPQRMILNHPATGGFVTHCGWSSLAEAMRAGLPIVAWPLHSEQFINERHVVNLLRMGVSVLEGVKRSIYPEQRDVVKADLVKRAIERVMGNGEEPDQIRRSATKFKDVLTSVLEKGGSSYSNLTSLIDELTAIDRPSKTKRTSP